MINMTKADCRTMMTKKGDQLEEHWTNLQKALVDAAMAGEEKVFWYEPAYTDTFVNRLKSAGFNVTCQKRGDIYVLCIDWAEQPKYVEPVEQWQQEKNRVQSHIRYAMEYGWNHVQTWIALQDHEKVLEELERIGYQISILGMNRELVRIDVEWSDAEMVA